MPTVFVITGRKVQFPSICTQRGCGRVCGARSGGGGVKEREKERGKKRLQLQIPQKCNPLVSARRLLPICRLLAATMGRDKTMWIKCSFHHWWWASSTTFLRGCQINAVLRLHFVYNPFSFNQLKIILFFLKFFLPIVTLQFDQN